LHLTIQELLPVEIAELELEVVELVVLLWPEVVVSTPSIVCKLLVALTKATPDATLTVPITCKNSRRVIRLGDAVTGTGVGLLGATAGLEKVLRAVERIQRQCRPSLSIVTNKVKIDAEICTTRHVA
jgi:hypothetical protein